MSHPFQEESFLPGATCFQSMNFISFVSSYLQVRSANIEGCSANLNAILKPSDVLATILNIW